MSSALKPVDKAAVLIESLPWLERFHGKIVVVKYGGHAMTDAGLRKASPTTSSSSATRG